MADPVADPVAGSPLAADRQARRLAQTDFARPLVLEAGAGTGKTTTLVARVLAWCLGPGWLRHQARLEEERKRLGRRRETSGEEIAAATLGRVVAITFTEAAAAEMAERVAQELARLAQAAAEPPAWLVAELPPADERARRAGALLATLDHLVVRTIHAFCRGLLAAHPLEARLHPELTIDPEGLRVEEVARETVETALRGAYVGRTAAADDPFLALAVAGHGPQKLIEALVTLVQAGVPADGLDEDPTSPARVAALRGRIATAAARLHALLAPHAGSLKHNAGKLCTALSGLGDRLGGDLPSILATLAEDFPDPGKGLFNQLAKWRAGDFNKSEQAVLSASAAEISAAAADLRAVLRHAGRLDPELLALAHRALGPLLRTVRRELRGRGIVTFEDLLAEAARLLATRGDVAARERARIDQLLVDEFQDTDLLQCEIVARLALDGPAERRPGLFLVGDPKQSIYGWRSADLAAYQGFVERVEAAGGVRRPLVENFRSVPAILEEVTRAIEPVMLAAEGVQPAYEALVACQRLAGDAGFSTRSGGGLPRGAVEHWVSWQSDADEQGLARDGLANTPKGAADALEAAAIAADLADLHDREGVAWKEMALLLRAATDLDVYLEALREQGVPFAVGRDKQYYRRREVIDAAALVRAVLDPGDHVALLTLLRSPAVGVPDAALIPLWNRDLPRRLTELAHPDSQRLLEISDAIREAAAETPRDVPGIERLDGWPASLNAAVEHLAHARAAFRAQEADRFVALLRSLFLVEATAAARYLGSYRLANLERFFRRLTAALEEGGGDVTAVLRTLKRSVAEAREAPEGQPGEGDRDAVQVMTIHQAKGLDWQHVYLPQLHHLTRGWERPFEVERVEREGGSGFEARLFDAPTLGWDRVAERRRRVEAAERVRLLYVAMTRAKLRLVLAGKRDETPEPADPERARSLLHLLAHRTGQPTDLADRFRHHLATDPGAAPTLTDPAGALWRFPAAVDWPRAPAREPAPSPPAASGLAAASRRLARRQAEAEAHRARPFAVAASAEAHHRLRELHEEEALPPLPHDRAVAMAAGTAIHRALEELEAANDPAEETARLREALAGWLPADLPPETREAATAVARDLLDHLATGPLLARLRTLAPHVLARELPVLVAPPESADPSGGDSEVAENKALGKAADPFPESADPSGSGRPVGYFSGAIDLLYRDPDDDTLVVADFKTDRVEGSGEAETGLERRAAAYAPQGRVYARAVAAGFGLADLPRFELWFLRAGRIVEVDLTGEDTTVLPPIVEPAAESADPFGERAEETDEGAEESAEPKSAEPEPRADAGGQFKLFE